MKKYLVLSCLTLSALYSCKKEKEQPKKEAMVYTISGPKDTVYAYGALDQAVNVTYTSGDKSSVQLSLGGLPKGLNARFADSAGTPGFETLLRFSHDDYIAPGTYPLTINAQAANAGTQSVSFNMSIRLSCAAFMAGGYSAAVTYASSGEQFNNTKYTALTKEDKPNRLYFYERNNTEADFYGDLDCSTGTLTIPAQSKPGSSLQYSGSGTLATKTHGMTFTLLTEGLPTLKFVLTRP
ncbi:MAG: hypothetical protein JNL13_02200 [Chitinophagaceae bacterium]|nr:hypothetical protein [Chitinophagaceae bacterium]